MASELYPPANREQHGLTLVTPKWLKARRAAATALRAVREASEQADTDLLVVAAQHPLRHGKCPGDEFTVRLKDAFNRFIGNARKGDKTEFFLPGNRHHDSASGQTDRVALYDAAGRWLVDKGVAPELLHGNDWIDQAGELVYNGADELRVAAWGFANNPRFRSATYFCSPGQRARAERYALAFDLPADIEVPAELLSQDGEQFHDQGLKQMILRGITKFVDPYGDWLAKQVADRVPTNGPTGTPRDMLSLYSDMPWYSASNQ